MTIRELEAYGILKKEVEQLEARIADLMVADVEQVDAVKTVSKEPPFLPRLSKVVACKTHSKLMADITELYRIQLERLVRMLKEIEVYIAGIGDSEIRQIARLRYLDGRTWREIPQMMGYDGTGTTEFQKFKRYMRDDLMQSESLNKLNKTM